MKVSNLLVGENVISMSFFDCYLTPHPSDVTRFANILNAYSFYTLFKKERTLGEDFGMSHISPFIVGFATTHVGHGSFVYIV